MDIGEPELESDTTLLYPTSFDSDDEVEMEGGSHETTYLFPSSEFEPDGDSPGRSKEPTRGELIRNSIVHDMISLILRRVIPNRPVSPRQSLRRNIRQPILSRDDIIRQAMEQAFLSRGQGEPLHTQSLLQRTNLNSKPKIPPIKSVDDPDLRELIRRGRSQGYSEAAILKTRRDNDTRRLLVPSKEEAETVAVWRREEQYRSSIEKLKQYTL